jgi:CspA family cold shock protein
MDKERKILKGHVCWFDSKKGYGYITPLEGDDYFVHYSSIQLDGFKTLKEGQSVEFEEGQNDKGKCAINVVIKEA